MHVDCPLIVVVIVIHRACNPALEMLNGPSFCSFPGYLPAGMQAAVVSHLSTFLLQAHPNK